MANNVIRQWVKDIANNYYSIIADESIDISNTDFLAFFNIRNIEANRIISAIQDVLIRIQMPLKIAEASAMMVLVMILGMKS